MFKSYFQVVKFIANVLADSEQISVENTVVNKSPVEIRDPDKPSHSNDSYVFPRKEPGKQNRLCNLKWFKLYPWLEYDEISDSVTRFFCKNHDPKLRENVEKFFLLAEFGLGTCSFFVWWTKSLSSMTYEVIKTELCQINKFRNNKLFVTWN